MVGTFLTIGFPDSEMDRWTILKGRFHPLLPIVVIPTLDAISFHEIGVGTFLTIGFPDSDHYRYPVLESRFVHLLSVLVPLGIKTISLAVLV